MSKPSSSAAPSTNVAAAPSSDSASPSLPTSQPSKTPLLYAAAARSSGPGSATVSRAGSGAATPNLASSFVATAASSSVPSPAQTPSLSAGQSPFVASVSFGNSNAATPASSQPPSKAGSVAGDAVQASAKGQQVNGVARGQTNATAVPDAGSRDRRTSAIDIGRGHVGKPSASHISFGSLADVTGANDSVLSSSPANPPTITRREGAPVFGSMPSTAANTATKSAESSASTESANSTATTAPAAAPAKKEGGKKKYDFNAGFQQPAAVPPQPAAPPSSQGSHSPAPSVSARPDPRRGASTYDLSVPSNPTSPRPSSAAHLGPPPGTYGVPSHLSGASPSFSPRPNQGGPQGGGPPPMFGYAPPPPGWQPGGPGASPHLANSQLPGGFHPNGQGGPAGPQAYMQRGGQGGGPPNFQQRGGMGFNQQGGPPGNQMYGSGPGGRPPFPSAPSQNGGRSGGANGPTSPRLPPGAPPTGFPPQGQFWPGPQGPPGYGSPHPSYYPFAGMPTYPNPNPNPNYPPHNQHQPTPSPHLPPAQPPPGSAQSNASSRPDLASRPSNSSLSAAATSPASVPSGQPTPFPSYSAGGGGPPNFVPGTPGPNQQPAPGGGQGQPPMHQRTASLSFKAPAFSPGAPEFKPGVAFSVPRKSAAIEIKRPAAPPTPQKGTAAAAEKERDAKEAAERAEAERAEAEEREKKEAEERTRLEEERKRKEEEEEAARKKAEEEAAEAKRKEEEAAAKRKAEEEEAARRAEEERKRAEEEAERKRKEEEEAAKEKARLEQEAKEQAEREEKGRLQREAKQAAEQKAKEEAERAAKEKAEAEAKEKAEAEARSQAEEAVPLPDPSSLPGLPSKPVNGVSTPPTKVRPSPIDVSGEPNRSADAVSTPSSALQAARNIEDLNQVTYPDNIQSPRAELNVDATPGKFRYDRDFLLQFMAVCKEKPEALPSLEAIGMTDVEGFGAGGGLPRSQSFGGQRRGASGPAPGLVRGVSGSSTPMAPMRMGSGQMPVFGSGAARTSEERFAQATARGVMGSMAIGSGFLPGRPGAAAMGSRPPSVSGLAGPAGREGRRSGTGRQRGPKGGAMAPPLATPGGMPVAPLQVSANSWGAQRNATQLDEDSPEMVQRKVKALLNKLTLDKFPSISDQVLEWANKSEKENDGRILRQVIALIFEKATDEAHWSSLYAALCRKLMEMLSPSVRDEGVRDTSGNPVAGGNLFRKYLLNRCQEDYERGWSRRDELVAVAAEKAAEDSAKQAANEKARAEAEASGSEPAKEAELMSDEYYAAQKAKRQGLGLVRFIGELYKLQMLTERIMHECIKKLLSNIEEPEEEDIESLCRLMTTVGKLLDHDKAHKHMDVYFQRMAQLTKNQKLTSRARFMVQDVIDARQNGWVIRNEASGPKLISEIHQEAAAQAAESARAAAQLNSRGPRGLGDPMSRGGSRAGQRRDAGFGGVPSADGWAQVGNAPPVQRPSKAGDLSHFGKVREASSGRPNLGPSSSVFANKGRKDGKATPDRDQVATAANPFAALENTGVEAPSQSLSRRTSQADLASASRPKLNLAPRTLPLPSESQEKADEDAKENEEEEEEEISDEKAQRMIDNSVQEWFSVKDVGEGVASFTSLPKARRQGLLKAIGEKALDKKLADVELTAKLFSKLAEEQAVTPEVFTEAFKATVEPLEDLSVDNPSAFKFAGVLLKGSQLDQARVEKIAESIEPIDESPEDLKTRLIEAYSSAA